MIAHRFAHALYKLLGMLKIARSMRAGDQKQKYDLEWPYYSLRQILYYHQLITHFIPRTIRAATVLLLVLVQPNTRLLALAITRTITGHTRTSRNTDYCHNCTQKCVISITENSQSTTPASYQCVHEEWPKAKYFV